VQCSELMTTH